MTMLDGIIIEGFKSIACASVNLRPLNVLIGANGSGKSNFIGAFSFLHTLSQGQLQSYVGQAGGADRILHFGSKVTLKLEIQVSLDRNRAGYSVALSRDKSDGLYLTMCGYHPPSDDGDEQVHLSEREGYLLPPEHIREHIGNWQLYHFHDTSSTSPMKKTADVNDNRYLRPDGSNLAAFLYYLREKHDRSYRLIRRTVQLVAPFFEDFLLEPQALNEDKIRLEWRHRGTDAYFDASSFSDGSLRFVALTTLLLQPVSLRPSLILLDEPELGLHPYGIAMLASLLKQASAETQIALATQSPLLLDHFQPGDVLVADRVCGATEVRRLDEQDLKNWLKDYSLGQLWEKNELNGRPAVEKGSDWDGS